jgi:hypothetical protein
MFKELRGRDKHEAGQARLLLFPHYRSDMKLWEMTYWSMDPGLDVNVAGSDIVTVSITHKEALALNARGEFVRYEE